MNKYHLVCLRAAFCFLSNSNTLILSIWFLCVCMCAAGQRWGGGVGPREDQLHPLHQLWEGRTGEWVLCLFIYIYTHTSVCIYSQTESSKDDSACIYSHVYARVCQLWTFVNMNEYKKPAGQTIYYNSFSDLSKFIHDFYCVYYVYQ